VGVLKSSTAANRFSAPLNAPVSQRSRFSTPKKSNKNAFFTKHRK